jgi:hypothetical protein
VRTGFAHDLYLSILNIDPRSGPSAARDHQPDGRLDLDRHGHHGPGRTVRADPRAAGEAVPAAAAASSASSGELG